MVFDYRHHFVRYCTAKYLRRMKDYFFTIILINILLILSYIF